MENKLTFVHLYILLTLICNNKKRVEYRESYTWKFHQSAFWSNIFFFFLLLEYANALPTTEKKKSFKHRLYIFDMLLNKVLLNDSHKVLQLPFKVSKCIVHSLLPLFFLNLHTIFFFFNIAPLVVSIKKMFNYILRVFFFFPHSSVRIGACMPISHR